MKDTTGWRKVDGGLRKLIDHQYFHIERYENLKCWDLFIWDMHKQFLTDRPTLRECQRLAHATARLWAGETPDAGTD